MLKAGEAAAILSAHSCWSQYTTDRIPHKRTKIHDSAYCSHKLIEGLDLLLCALALITIVYPIQHFVHACIVSNFTNYFYTPVSAHNKAWSVYKIRIVGSYKICSWSSQIYSNIFTSKVMQFSTIHFCFDRKRHCI